MKEYKLGDIVTFHYGKSLPKTKRINGPFPVMSSAGVTGWHNESLVKGPGVIVGRKGSIGTVFYEKRDFFPIDTCYFLTVNEPQVVDLKFLYYLLLGSNLKDLNSDAAVPGLNRDIAYSQKFLIPELNVQEKVVELIDDYNDLIENNNRRITILEDMAQSLYREWFVNFRYPDHADNLDADGNPKLVDLPLGLIPEGWEVKPLGELVEFKRKTIKKGTVSENTPYMGLEHFPRKSIALSNWEEVSEIGSNKLAFSRGDILFGKIRPNFHKVGVAQVDGLCSSDTFVLSPKERTHHSLIAMVTFSNEFVAQAVQTAQGSKMPRASWDVLQEFAVYVPDLKTLESFNSVVTPAIEQIRALSLKNRNLKLQRDMLLPKLISGQIEL
ncbi:type I restriction-modification enzyme, S subunit [Vibrio inusitatus NBRC 102082]|uniref:Type I restriction-modification enzyme, S subunit n=1 Tax=Vibrio inusitatus NBRC 102082 TaxID=1219070 RepID=A0A4Y3HVM5_9VIBR|nr:restriction endonuclease subunit S [Vibrio inusitatus]GEA51156.1 type I restriction-modification enzyme, S subunit [Vibrio inusitatus NBRC 102082]